MVDNRLMEDREEEEVLGEGGKEERNEAIRRKRVRNPFFIKGKVKYLIKRLKPGKPGRKKQQCLTSTSHDADKSDSSTSLNNSSLLDIPGPANLSGDAFEGSLKAGKPGRKRKQKYGGPNSQMKKKQKRLTSTSHDADKSDCATDVWWDLENAGVPYDLHPKEVYGRFLKKLREEGFIGRVKIRIIVGYKDSISPKVKKGLYKGVGVNKKNFQIKYANKFNRPKNSARNQVADLRIKRSIKHWLAKGRKPQNTMIVTGDNGFKGVLEKLLKAGHTTLLAFREDKSQSLTSARLDKFAKFRWNWRVFLSLPEKSISKRQRSAEFEERKRKAAEFRGQEEIFGEPSGVMDYEED